MKRGLLLLAVLALPACVAPLSTLQPEVRVQGGLTAAATGAVSGRVTAPIIAAGAGNLIGQSSSNLIGNAAANFAPSAAERGVGELEEVPVVGARVVLRDARTLKRLGSAAGVHTGADGRFRVANVPAGVNFIVEAVGAPTADKGFRVLGLARASFGAEAPEAAVGQASTLLTARLLKDAAQAGHTGRIYLLEPERVAALTTSVRAALASASEPQRRAAASSLLVAASAGRVETPASYEPTAFESAELALEAVSADAALAAGLKDLRATLARPLSKDEQKLVAAFSGAATGTPFSPPPASGAPAPAPAPEGTGAPAPAPASDASGTGITLVNLQISGGAAPAGLINVAAPQQGATTTGVAGALGAPFDEGSLEAPAGAPALPTGALESRGPALPERAVWTLSRFADRSLVGFYVGAVGTARADNKIERLVVGLLLPDGRKQVVFDTRFTELADFTNAAQPVGYVSFDRAVSARGLFVLAQPVGDEALTLTDVRALVR